MELYITTDCNMCGACSQIYNNVFEITKYGAIANNDKLKNEDKCYDAIFYCPTNAIKIR